MVRKSVMFSNVIVDIDCVQSLVERFSASLTGVGGVTVGATIDLIDCSLSVPRFVFFSDVSRR